MTPETTALARLGGKGANLERLRQAGLPVPPFVVVETGEYRTFVAAAGLQPMIGEALGRDAAEASATIRAAFAAAAMKDAQRARLAALVAPLAEGDAGVAVRSSATAEDLPGFSFAGQQDTFLQVRGTDAVLDRVIACWSSLWTERAITYRTRNGFGHDGLALAVVVQQMVDAEASGVLFTANPRTGRRDETVIDATFGLGEALVSGRVTPDNYVVATTTGAVRARSVSGATPTLNPTQLRSLTALGRRVAGVFGEPQDVEWARVGDTFSILQARPVTGLYPLPATGPRPGEGPAVWASFGAFQGMLAPITPLGQEMLQMLLAGAPRLVGRRVDWRTNWFLQPAGERLWVRLDRVLRTRLSRRLLLRFLPLAEPSVAQILTTLSDEPGLRVVRPAPRPTTMASLAAFVSRVYPRARAASANPAAARRHVERVCEDLVGWVAELVDRAADRPTPQARLSARADVMDQMAHRFFPALLPAFGPIMAPTVLLLARLRGLARLTKLPDADALALAVLRALPGNVTTEMDLRLGDLAAEIRSDATAWGWVEETPAEDLARQYLAGNLPTAAQRAIAAFMDDYGMRGVAEIDLGAPRWRDDPTPVMATLRAFVAVTDPDAQPRAVHKAGQHEAGRSIRRLMDASTPARAQQIRTMAKTIRAMFGARETPKFAIVRSFGLLRDGLDASARELVAQGRLDRAEDVYFLRVDELRRAFSGDWRAAVAARRAVLDAEARRGQVPRVLVSDGRALFEGLGASEGDLSGMGVSPGVAEGRVRVVRDPREAHLEPGDILVCPGTDPAWTPLFLTAGGLVTEVGGLMTHGSVVAREYGIPAVVGVHDATGRLTDGQRVRLDGTSGAIELL